MNELTVTKLLKFKFLCQTKAHHKCTQTSGLWVSITLDIWKRSYDGIGGAAFKKDLPFVSKKLENFKILLLIDFLFDCMLLNLGLESIEMLVLFVLYFVNLGGPNQMNLNKKCEYKGQENSVRILKVVKWV